MATVWMPPPMMSSAIAEPCDDPEFGALETPIVLLLIEPLKLPAPTPPLPMERAEPTASRNVLFVIEYVSVAFIGDDPLEIVNPPPPGTMFGWLFDRALPVNTRSPTAESRMLYWNRSPRAEVRKLFCTVTFNVAVPVAWMNRLSFPV